VATLHLTRGRLHAARLDGQLADGADPAGSEDLTVRAGRLLRPRERAALAHSLRRTVAEARGAPCPRGCVHVARAAVRDCAPELLALAAELGDPGVRPQGVALTRRLLADATGPLYAATDADGLRAAVQGTRDAL
jgi:hypothetical protein